MNTTKTKSEISAGGVIVCKDSGTWYVLVMLDKSDEWTFPKGKIEQGESDQDAALREISEEVGLTNLTVVSTLAPIQYWYYRDGAVSKTVRYFVFQSATRTPPVVSTEEGIKKAEWVSWHEVAKNIGYKKTNLPILSEVESILSRLNTL